MPKSDENDLFAESTMTFGEHLEELRGALLKCVLGLAVGALVGLYFGNRVVHVIARPLKNALGNYYTDESVHTYEQWVADRRNNNQSVPYDPQDVEAVVRAYELLFDIQYVDRQQLDQKLHWAPPGEASQGNAGSESAEPQESNEATAEEIKERADQLVQKLVPVIVWHSKDDDGRINPKTLHAAEGFTLYLKAALLFGAVLTSPWIFYHIWTFVAAGLYPHEKQFVHVFLPFSLGLFLLGVSTVFLFVFEPVLTFLFGFNEWLGIDPDPRITEWLGFVLFLPLGFGIAFQLPLVMLFLERIGIFNVRAYLEKWRMAIMVVFILSALLTPADPYSLLLLAMPLTVLYFCGILLCRWMPRSKSPLDD